MTIAPFAAASLALLLEAVGTGATVTLRGGDLCSPRYVSREVQLLETRTAPDDPRVPSTVIMIRRAMEMAYDRLGQRSEEAPALFLRLLRDSLTSDSTRRLPVAYALAIVIASEPSRSSLAAYAYDTIRLPPGPAAAVLAGLTSTGNARSRAAGALLHQQDSTIVHRARTIAVCLLALKAQAMAGVGVSTGAEDLLALDEKFALPIILTALESTIEPLHLSATIRSDWLMAQYIRERYPREW